MQDDVAYNHSATLYRGAPINVRIATFPKEEEEAILGIRNRFLFLHANASLTGDDTELDQQLDNLKKSWFTSWNWATIRSNFGCLFPTDPFLNNSGCFSTYKEPFDFWGNDRSNNAYRFKIEVDMLHTLAFHYVSSDRQNLISADNLRQFVLEGLASLVDRGLSKETFDPGLLDSEWGDTCSLYFTDKDGNYASGWSQVPFYQRTEGVLSKLVLLFRSDLKSSGIFDSIMGALGTFTARWGHGERWLSEENFAKCFQHGMNSDMSRFVLTDRSVAKKEKKVCAFLPCECPDGSVQARYRYRYASDSRD
jgi:hypothetical protein